MQGTWVLPWVGKIPWRRKRQPTPVFLFGKFHGQRILVSYSPWGPKTIGQDLMTKWQQWTSYCFSVIKLCPTLSNPMDCSTLGFPVLHHLHQFAQTHVHWVDDAIQPSHFMLPLFSSCPQSFPASESFPVSRLFESGGQATEFQLQHQPFQWIFRTDFL